MFRMSRKLTTAEAAEAIGIGRVTLQLWIRARKIKAPKTILRNGRGVRLWAHADMERLRQTKEAFYRKGQGRKPKRKAKRQG